jgi:ribosomal protein S24E
MQVKIDSTKNNALLKRKEVTFTIFSGPKEKTPKRLDAKKAVAAEMQLGDDVVFIKRMRTKTGTSITVGDANVYQSPLTKLKLLNLNISGNVTVHLKNPKKRRQHNVQQLNQHPKKRKQTPAAAEAAPAAKPQQSQRRNVRKNTKKRRVSMRCTRLKATKFLGHAQLASGVDQATSWETTMTGSLVDTAALHVTSQSK